MACSDDLRMYPYTEVSDDYKKAYEDFYIHGKEAINLLCKICKDMNIEKMKGIAIDLKHKENDNLMEWYVKHLRYFDGNFKELDEFLYKTIKYTNS